MSKAFTKETDDAPEAPQGRRPGSGLPPGATNYLTTQRASQRWADWWEPTNLLTMAMITPEMHVA